jgi:hypothetical protein
MTTLAPTAAQAIALTARGESPEAAAEELAATADRAALEQAQAELVQRVHERSDDFTATAALSLVNKALAKVGWVDPFSWKHRRKP